MLNFTKVSRPSLSKVSGWLAKVLIVTSPPGSLSMAKSGKDIKVVKAAQDSLEG